MGNFWIVPLLHSVSDVVKSEWDNFPSECIRVTTASICCSGTAGAGKIGEGWTSVKQRKVSVVASGNS